MKGLTNEVFEIYQSILEKIYTKIESYFSVLFRDTNFEEVVDQKLIENKEEINIISQRINGNALRKLIKHPQINDLVVESFSAIVLENIFNENKNAYILVDNSLNYLLQVIFENYQELSEDTSVEAIKELWKIFSETVSIDSKVYDTDMLKDIYGNSKKDVHGNPRIQKVEDNVSRMLAVEYISKNGKYDQVRNEYLKAIKQIYQNGFIYLLGEYKFNEFYIPPILLAGMRNADRHLKKYILRMGDNYRYLRDNWKDIFCGNELIYVVGGAGYGKSLFLRNIINNYSKLNIDNSSEYLLVYCDLKTYYSNGDYNKKSMIDFFQESMVNITGLDRDNITKEFIQYSINMGRCIFLLDALDEVPKEVREDLHHKISGFFATCNPNNKVCITSRDRGFIPQENIEVFEIYPLTETDIADYLDKMVSLRKFKKEDKESFMKQAQVLIEKDFLNNFLVLSLLVNIYKAEKELPENKIDLYKKCFEYIAKKREEEKSKTGYNWTNIYPLMKDSTFISLSTLAVPNNEDIRKEDVEELLLRHYKTKYPDEATAEGAIKEFLEFCSNRTELFVPSSVDDKYKFFHRSFFEYFYSRYIHQQSDISKMYELMTSFDVDSEVFELTIALVKEDNEIKYQELVQYILEKVEEGFSQQQPDYTAFGILTLAMQVIDDAYFIQKYFEIVIKYSNLMNSEQVLHMKQKYIYLWIIKAIGTDKEKQNLFKKAFENKCIMDTFLVCSDLLEGDDARRHEIISYLSDEDDREILFSVNGRRAFYGKRSAFYMLVYREYYDLQKRLEKVDRRSLNIFVGSNNVPRSKKQDIRKGYSNYNKLEKEQKEKVIAFLCTK